jgi:hypothetical protein
MNSKVEVLVLVHNYFIGSSPHRKVFLLSRISTCVKAHYERFLIVEHFDPSIIELDLGS